MNKFVYGLAAVLIVSLLSGCVGIPQKIKGDNNLLKEKSVSEVVNNISLYKGREARFGGQVVNVMNRPDETLIEIAVLPLDSSAKPEIHHPFQGRLIVRSPIFMEPLTFRNHLITVLGTITGNSKGKIGSAQSRFLNMDLIGYQIWHLDDVVISAGPWDYGVGPYWDGGWDAPGYPYGWGWYPGDQSLVVEQPEVVR